MKKKLLIICLVTLCMLTVTACRNTQSENADTSTENPNNISLSSEEEAAIEYPFFAYCDSISYDIDADGEENRCTLSSAELDGDIALLLTATQTQTGGPFVYWNAFKTSGGTPTFTVKDGNLFVKLLAASGSATEYQVSIQSGKFKLVSEDKKETMQYYGNQQQPLPTAQPGSTSGIVLPAENECPDSYYFLDSIEFDIDGDGEKENLTMETAPVKNGYALLVYSNEKDNSAEYSLWNVFLSKSNTAYFIGGDSELKIAILKDLSSADEYSVTAVDGKIVLSNISTSEALAYYGDQSVPSSINK